MAPRCPRMGCTKHVDMDISEIHARPGHGGLHGAIWVSGKCFATNVAETPVDIIRAINTRNDVTTRLIGEIAKLCGNVLQLRVCLPCSESSPGKFSGWSLLCSGTKTSKWSVRESAPADSWYHFYFGTLLPKHNSISTPES